MKQKPKILLTTERSLSATGYGSYAYELLQGLAKTDKYDLAELAAWGWPGEPATFSLPWKYYPNLPNSDDEAKAYESRPSAQFGEFKFDSVCVDFKPNIILDFRDHWFSEFVGNSPARPFFNFIWQPTIDSLPQRDEWFSAMQSADKLLTYTDYGYDEIKKYPEIKLFKRAYPGVNFDDFKPLNKKQSRKEIGLPEDMLIIGTVMRNQPRKLFPDLMQTFAKFIQNGPKYITDKCYLYLHTCFPDGSGWNMTDFIKENAGLSTRTLFTYQCNSCGKIAPSLFRDKKTICKSCGRYSVIMPQPSTSMVDKKALCKILSTFDAYVQYATCEGMGMTVPEAAASGVPVFAVDYSAMSEVVRKLNGYPISIKRMFRDFHVNAERAMPDNEDLIQNLTSYLSLPEPVRIRKGLEASKACKKHFSWEQNIKVWEEAIDSFAEEKDRWGKQKYFHQPNLQIPDGMNDVEFINWGLKHIAGRSDMINGHKALVLYRNICKEENPGYLQTGEPLTRDKCIDYFLNLCEQRNNFEKAR